MKLINDVDIANGYKYKQYTCWVLFSSLKIALLSAVSNNIHPFCYTLSIHSLAPLALEGFLLGRNNIIIKWFPRAKTSIIILLLSFCHQGKNLTLENLLRRDTAVDTSSSMPGQGKNVIMT